MIKKYRNYLLGVIGILLALTMIVGVKYLMNQKYEELPEIKLKDINNKKSFAIMVRDGDGYEEYTSENNTWPGSDYVFKEAKCVDNNGSLVKDAITFADGKATLTTNKTIYCTLYFDEKKVEITNANKICDMGTSMSIEFTTSDPVTEYYYSTNGKDFTKSSDNIYSVQGLAIGGTQKVYVYAKTNGGKQTVTKEYDFTTKVLGKSMTASELRASNPKDLSTTIQGNMYRYQAAPADETEAAQMTNWIVFGTNECTNEYVKDKIDKYMYRIIGITKEGQMYLIKETFLKEGSGTTFSWNDKYSVDSSSKGYCDNGLCPDWNSSILFKRINGTSNGTETGRGSTQNKEWTDIFVDNPQYDYLKSGDSINGTKDNKGSEWYQLIADHEWMYGDIRALQGDTSTYTGDTVYAIESGNEDTYHYVGTKGNMAWQQYNWKNNPTLITKISLMYIHDVDYAYPGGNPESATNIKKSWIHFQKDGYNASPTYDWLSSRLGIYDSQFASVEAHCVSSDGYVFHNDLFMGGGARPVFYLSATVKIASGDGTKANPYILEI